MQKTGRPMCVSASRHHIGYLAREALHQSPLQLFRGVNWLTHGVRRENDRVCVYTCTRCSCNAEHSLQCTHLDDVFVGATLLRIAVLGVLEQDAVHVRAGILEQLVGTVEHDQSDLAVAQNAQLVSLLHQAKLALRECHLHNEKYASTSEMKTEHVCLSVSILMEIFPGEPGLAGSIEAKDDGGGGDNWNYKLCKAPVKSSLPTNQHQTFYRQDALPVAQPCQSTEGKNITFRRHAHPKLAWGHIQRN